MNIKTIYTFVFSLVIFGLVFDLFKTGFSVSERRFFALSDTNKAFGSCCNAFGPGYNG